jgi:prevent-host-death family protein
LQKVGLFEAKQKLSELVARAKEGEQIGITRRGKLCAIIVPPRGGGNLSEVFDQIESIRKRARRKRQPTTKQLIEEGRV